MAFPDPHTFFPTQAAGTTTVGDGVDGAQDLDLISRSGSKSKYTYVDTSGGLLHCMEYDHSVTSKLRRRHLLKYTVSKIAADPLHDGVSMEVETSMHFVINEPPVGFTALNISVMFKTFMQYMGAANFAGLPYDFIAGQS